MRRRLTVTVLTFIFAVLIMGQLSVQPVDAESSGTYRGISYTITDDDKLQLGAPGVTQEMTAENTPFRPENKSKFDEVEFLGKVKANGSISGLFGGAGRSRISAISILPV